MVTAVVESPLRQRQRQRLRSPLASTSSGSDNGSRGEFELRHWRHVKRVPVTSGGMRGRRWAPPAIEIPSGGGLRGSYTSLRDIMSSPEYAKATISSSRCPDDEAAACGCGGAAGDVHMIRHPLVKHAAYAYLQLTPSARDEEGRRRRGRRGRGVLCRIFYGCLGFVGALFGR